MMAKDKFPEMEIEGKWRGEFSPLSILSSRRAQFDGSSIDWWEGIFVDASEMTVTNRSVGREKNELHTINRRKSERKKMWKGEKEELSAERREWKRVF